MTSVRSPRRALRQNLLTSAGAVLAAFLASPTLARSSQDVRADAARALVNQQTNRSGTSADASDTSHVISTAGPIESSSASVTDTVTAATARANRIQQSLALDPVDLASNFGSTSLVAGDDHAVADTSVAVINYQSMLGAPVDATIAAARTALEAGSINDSKLALSRNTQDATALGNDGSNTISLAGVSSDSGAGIVSVQKTDAASTVSAFSGGQQTLSAQSVDASALDLNANLARATSYGNTVDNALSAKLVHAAAPESESIASIVPVAGNVDAAVGAAFSVLSSQSVGSDVVASVGNQSGGATFRTLVDGSLSNSSASTTNNMLSSGVAGNQSGNTVNLDAGAFGVGANGATEPIANVTNVQRVCGLDAKRHG